MICTKINRVIINSVSLLINNTYEYENCPVSANQNYKLIMCTVVLHSVVYWEKCWLYSLTEAGRKDLWYLSFTHLDL